VDDPRDTRPLAPAGRGQILQFPKAGAARQPSAASDANDSAKTGELSGADLFALLWHALADVLGTAAAATLLRRATLRPAMTFPELSALEITRAALEYQYRVPDAWNRAAPEPPAALSALVRELWTLLVELTGPVVVTRLSQVPELRACGQVPATERRP
jgi:hypothetical protein